jgi:hypothetical protein
MSWQRSLQAAVRDLRKEEQSLVRRLDHLRGRIAELTGVSKAKRGAAGRTRTNRLSASGRRAISLAAKRRWAKYRKTRR